MLKMKECGRYCFALSTALAIRSCFAAQPDRSCTLFSIEYSLNTAPEDHREPEDI